MIIPTYERTHIYQDNLIAGLAMYMVGPMFWRIAFRIFVVVVGFLILSGAINTSMIGSTGVLMRVAEDGVLTDWFRKPHTRFGTSYRIVNLVFILQMTTIIATRGNIIMLGEAYAFGVIWSFTFNALPCWCCAGNTTANAAGKFRRTSASAIQRFRLASSLSSWCCHHRRREPVHQVGGHR